MFRGLVCKVFVLMKMVVMVAVIHEESEISVLVSCVMRSWRALDFAYTLCELQTRIWTNFSQVGGEL